MIASAADTPDLSGIRTLGDAGQEYAASAAPGEPAARTKPLAESTNMEGAIRCFFDAFNRRDLQQMADAVAEDVEHCNLAYAKPYPKGKHHVVEFYKEFVDAVPRSAKFVIEDTTGTNSSGTIGVIWCVHPSCKCIHFPLDRCSILLPAFLKARDVCAFLWLTASEPRLCVVIHTVSSS